MYASRVQPPAFGRARTESNFRHLLDDFQAL